MPDVSSIGNGHFGHLNRSTVAPTTLENGIHRPDPRSPETDRVELSAGALDRLREVTEVRQDLVDSVRRSIADGTYDTDERLNDAIERLLEDLN